MRKGALRYAQKIRSWTFNGLLLWIGLTSGFDYALMAGTEGAIRCAFSLSVLLRRMTHRSLQPLSIFHSKNKTPYSGSYSSFRCETKTGVVRIFVIFQDKPMFSHTNGKLSPRPFE